MKRSLDNMAPSDKYLNDATFQCLLSSQRELLSQLKGENSRADDYNIDPTHSATATTNTPWFDNKAAPIVPTNQPIGPYNYQTYRYDNVLLSKRLSMGVGNDTFVLPEDDDEAAACSADSIFGDDSDDGKKRKASLGNGALSAKRRRSTLPFLGYLFDKSNQQDEQVKPSSEEPALLGRVVEYLDSDDEDYGVIVEDVEDDNNVAGSKMVSFDTAMSATQDSQQKIHDWDRKMGLKRSHSKTMRLSSRSRKHLRQVMKKSIQASR